MWVTKIMAYMYTLATEVIQKSAVEVKVQQHAMPAQGLKCIMNI